VQEQALRLAVLRQLLHQGRAMTVGQVQTMLVLAVVVALALLVEMPLGQLVETVGQEF
jgi:hypothetical protein